MKSSTSSLCHMLISMVVVCCIYHLFVFNLIICTCCNLHWYRNETI